MTVSRRDFLATSAASLAFGAMHRAFATNASIAGSLIDPQAAPPTSRGPLALPPGFRQVVLSPTGSLMDDGLLVPGKHDGMGAFDAGNGKVLLVRNHEIDPAMGVAIGAFGPKLEHLGKVDLSRLYDAGPTGVPCLGGTTTLLYDPNRQVVERQFLSLCGTSVNCAGGVTPWGSWISCEECVYRPNEKVFSKDHGYCFEVPAAMDGPGGGGLIEAKPLKALGRFTHEAVAFDPKRPVMYLTEDLLDSAFYRFLPTTPGKLADGGRLQVLVAIERPSFDSRNWPPLDGKGLPTGPPVIGIRMGERLTCRWMDIDEVESPKNDLRSRAFTRGAIRFARCEGIWHAGDAVYITATTGGPNALGQVWRYVPSPAEGTDAEAATPPTIELFLESHSAANLKNCDNLCAAPWGELFVCEDGSGADGIVRIKPTGEIHRFALNVTNDSELAGVCFSPDGNTLFVNVQNPGMTVAITGPWAR
ncbi:MAG: DUF839 domain-containing protein [Phycisphaerae bacterium]|jgi:secreted PhoX family phosphatase|nr:DUF839 domain-containing protein [Phycisphaerae bacterium]